ncbi:hypothetical protein [Paraburkholderia phosphatilytica]|uniref:hypothetical protein n=1 Tax=Paraburkholderia phosphatilytica TaxID=2282883 RepID=UPI000E4EBE7E|nr:hypothetical protein [Paraburkholderia phosphatilytica]
MHEPAAIDPSCSANPNAEAGGDIRTSPMPVLALSREAGMQIVLDARIGRQTYHSVRGTLTSLQRFADAVLAASRRDSRTA